MILHHLHGLKGSAWMPMRRLSMPRPICETGMFQDHCFTLDFNGCYDTSFEGGIKLKV